jgi:ATP-dependent Clp protease ATP-binding subunit ClpA
MFSPEFRNRLDSIIQFKPLNEQTILHVVDKFLTELETQLNEKSVTMEVDEEARAWLARHGHDPLMGARPMARLIQERLKRLLAEELLFGRLEHGGDVLVTVRDDDLAVDIRAESKTPARTV